MFGTKVSVQDERDGIAPRSFLPSKGQARGSRELQPGQYYLYPWKDDGATNLETYSPAHKQGDWGTHVQPTLMTYDELTVFHKILIKKLVKYELDEQIVRWIENCLSKQVQRVIISHTK